MRHLLSKRFLVSAFVLLAMVMSSALAKGVIIEGPRFP